MVDHWNRLPDILESHTEFGGGRPLEGADFHRVDVMMRAVCSPFGSSPVPEESHYSSGWEEKLRQVADRMADVLKLRLALLRVQGDVVGLNRKLEAMKHTITGCEVPVQTFAPEPYDLLRSLHVVIQPSEDEFMACFFDANLTAMGGNEVQAVENLKTLILDVFDNLASKPAKMLGPAPAKQLAVLREFIRKRV